MTAIRLTGWRVSATALLMSIMTLLASAMFAHAQDNALFQKVGGTALDLSADQQGRVAKIEAQRGHGAVEYVVVDSGILSGARVSMPLADEAPVFTLLERIDRAPNDYTWIGTISGRMDQAVLVVRDGEVTGQIDQFDADGSVERFSLTPLGGNLHALTEIDTSAFPTDHRPGPLPVAPRESGEQRTQAGTEAAGEQTAADGVEVDVLVAYTPEAEAASSNILNSIQLAVDLANAGYAASDANTRLRLVGTERTTGYSESGKTYNDLLYELTGSNGSFPVTLPAAMSTVHARRNALGADLVSLFVNHPSYCGLAWINSSVNFGFSVVTHDCVSNQTFAHELGHNFGALHDVASSSGTPPYAYGYGYIHPGNLWRTIQSYAGPCGNCPRINQFSNPNRTYNGAVTGTSTTHNVARVHRERVSTVAAFRASTGGGGTKAVMSSPTPGSTLTGTSATFSWSTGTNVTEYWLDVGSTGTGSNGIYNASTGTSTSRAVSGLPASGTLNVRLWSSISGSWQYNDYTYTMQAGVKAVMNSPAPSSTLTSTSATFSWSTGTAVTEYWLAVGPGGAGHTGVYNATNGTSTSRTVSGLPSSGTLYVRLWSRIAGVWQYNDYTYTMNAGGGTKAVMSSPAPGSTLTSTSATFNWSAGSGVTEYWLAVGPGGAGHTGVYNASNGTSTSRTVGGLPSSGTLYVRLWSRIAGVWLYNDYTYTMSAGGGTKAVMNSPAPGSTLTSTSATFNWSAGSGVTEYWLAVGPGGLGHTGNYNASNGTSTSRTVSGLPATGTIYVRLWSRIAGAWLYNDYTYTMSAGGTKAVMNSPAPGSTLTSTSATFSWSAGSGVTEYWLAVGPGGLGHTGNYNASNGTSTSRTVNGLPATGTIYVRLWSRIAGVWLYNDYTYTMNAISGASMSSPTPGSTLGSSSATFSWTAGSGVAEYWLDVGNSGVGSRNIYEASTGTTRSRSVGGLPSSGTINVRLWSRVSSTWSFRDYTYSMNWGDAAASLATFTDDTP